VIGFPERQRQTLLTAIKSMCRIFWGPDDRFCSSVQNGSFLIPFEALSTWVDYSPPDIIDKIRDVIDQHPNVPSFCSDLEEIYVRLFISIRGGIAAPLYQSCYEYENASLMGAPAGDMQKRFESKELSLDENMNEPPDHLSIELEYLYFLLETGWAGENRALLDEAASFAADILIPWLTQFSDRLAMETAGRFYVLITSVLISILQLLAAKKIPQPNKGMRDF
jgi:TorA-specific chaperone